VASELVTPAHHSCPTGDYPTHLIEQHESICCFSGCQESFDTMWYMTRTSQCAFGAFSGNGITNPRAPTHGPKKATPTSLAIQQDVRTGCHPLATLLFNFCRRVPWPT